LKFPADPRPFAQYQLVEARPGFEPSGVARVARLDGVALGGLGGEATARTRSLPTATMPCPARCGP